MSASQTAEFLRKFVKNHPKFLKNPMYVTGISYSGIVIPIIAEELYKGNDKGLDPRVNIQGYMAGNPLTDKTGDINSRLEYAYRMALISEELYEATRNDCNGEYAEADSNNLPCMSDLDEVNKRVAAINIQQILDPDCDPATNLGDFYDYATVWANDKDVMRALNVREGTVKEWLLCNLDMKYNYGC
ncbi:hypothetical protein L2E82_25064 [Cichorium intybus]|uniref:Uncharacterized protein n=1 Tax=Cichorium intybus TaxID=13427 RepID=A0ACB9E2T7_CICIN|nr:hypothetical protein L2E82_25064 [Cichorium intybus]